MSAAADAYMEDQALKEAIRKVALGFCVEEITEEYAVEDGEARLIKRRKTRKDVPPDLKAVNLLREGQDYAALSDEQLEAERQRLLRELQKETAQHAPREG